jgi:predicted DNA-binding transcriptional regulator AlpA
MIIDGEKYLTFEEVQKKTNTSPSLLYVKMKYAHFPKPFKPRVWKESEVDEYLEGTREVTDSSS